MFKIHNAYHFGEFKCANMLTTSSVSTTIQSLISRNNVELLWYGISFFNKYVSSLSYMFGYYMTVVLSQNAGNRAVQETETSRLSARAATNTTCSAETETRL